ncbi:MAG: ankyrin repeat domain-containing protein [Verrucomicrobiae bacterium]|nr:ankyrin repeat domain-containing protein [Verrucomicrobiae bacterium]
MPTEVNFHAGVPILRVRSHAVSLDFYVRVLGFKVDWNSSGMASVSRGCCSLMLCERLQGHPGTWVWIGVSDAEALHREFVSRGATIRLPPTNYPWSLEFHLEDPDGHVLRFGSDPKEDQPFSPWVAWYAQPLPMPFSDAVSGLMNGDFSRLAPLFARAADGSPSQIVRWHEAGLFRAEPAALKEAFTCACFNGCVEVVEHLLAQGMDPAGGAATGLNAFHWAANRGQLEVVRLLLRHRAPLEVRNRYGGTVLGGTVWAAVHEPKPAHPAIVEALLQSGAQVGEAEYPSGNAQIDEILRRYQGEV